ncbi:ATP-grasp domain-containing protein [Cytobacillus sp. IB215665]|nr:ATP-grasp domain-containing protein [Cytobacillus sp. IB215665]MDX8364346.1 ATP-grasp domain-containing protein [Cytobacillus sp. IB215665]
MLKAVKVAAEKINSNIKVYGADSDDHCIGRYFVDQFWKIPNFNKLTVDYLLQYCIENHITSIIPSRDGELLFFAKHKNVLNENGIFVMIATKKAVGRCVDKYLFSKFGTKHGYPVVQTETSFIDMVGDNQFYVVKERYGAGSKDIGLKLTKDQSIEYAEKLAKPIFQPYIEGDEISADVYVMRTGEVKGVVTRKRVLVVDGESQISTTFRDQRLAKLCSKMVTDLELYGHVVLQVIVDKNGYFHIIECNSRFGGASTLSIAAGLDSFYWFILETNGNDLHKHPFVHTNKEMMLVRYPEDLIL